MEETSNPYGKRGGEVAKQIIDNVIASNFKKRIPSEEKTIGEMEDEIMKLVQDNVKFIN